tara:strand:+ start:556 stop:1794 length:1239 start_codon:yes stop_codon:yes gene_type:complete
MSAKGPDKWLKYFSQGDVDTVVAKDRTMFKPFKGSTQYLSMGTPITVLKTDSYDSNQRVVYNSIIGTISISNITKPGIKPSKQLGLFKPQQYNITDKKLSIDTYVSNVMDHLEESPAITGKLELYLKALVCHYSNIESLATLRKMWSRDFPVSDINNDFGEIMGPIALFYSNIGKSKGLTFGKTAKIWVPSAPNEPLMDYAIYKGKKQYTFSAKSLATKQTNTVKCQDILGLLDKKQNEENGYSPKARHEKTDQYKILEILCDHPMVQGGYAIGNYLIDKGYKGEFQGLENLDAIKQLKGDPTKLPTPNFMQENFGGYIKKNKIPEKEQTPIGVLYNIEKKIAHITKTKLKFNDIFSDAVQNQIIYIKFAVSSDGTPDWKIETSEDFAKSEGIFLRSKTTTSRLTDKIGVQT